MKTNLVLMLLLLFFASACTEEAANFGKTDCYWELRQKLDELEEKYRDEMNYVDEDGHVQSTKVCIHQRDTTIIYASRLESLLISIQNDETTLCSDSSLTGEELLEFEARINERIADLKKAVDPDEGVYNCDS